MAVCILLDGYVIFNLMNHEIEAFHFISNGEDFIPMNWYHIVIGII